MRLVFLVIVAVCLWGYFNGGIQLGGGYSEMPAGTLANSEPVQKKLRPNKSINKDRFTYTLTHKFSLEALVLSQKRYSGDQESQISPVDLALGWEEMSNPYFLKDIRITQSGRFYRFRYNSTPIPHRSIELNSANMHMVPANDDIEKKLRNVRKGDVVIIDGYLMNARRNDGWRWKSSTTRSDTGGGACELVYVEKLVVR